MNQNNDQVIQMETALRSLSAEEPSEKLMRNLRVMALEAGQRKRVAWMPKLAAVGAAAAGIAIFALTMTPAKASAKSFEMLKSAASQVRSFQFTVKATDQKEAVTIAGMDSHLVIQADKNIIQIKAGEMDIYDPEENTITHFKVGGPIDTKEIQKDIQEGLAEGLKEMDLKKMLAEYEAKYGRKNIQISPVRSEGIRSVYDVRLADPKEPSRVQMTVDAQTDLPFRIQVEKRNGSGWTNEMTMEMKFGHEVDPNLLNPEFPAKAKRIDMDLSKMMGDFKIEP